uniref:SJCHGC02395 protein n=1 Tax=Schistosoma japonicum TaxID=6182 RepID=Q5BT84_SCHJA|nr:SJCHGC02395 protein [Schistosoma japonicum]
MKLVKILLYLWNNVRVKLPKYLCHTASRSSCINGFQKFSVLVSPTTQVSLG